MPTPIKDMKDMKIGALLVLKLEKVDGKTKWLCKCDCGNFCHYTGSNLRALKRDGNFPTCGCSRICFNGINRTLVGIETSLVKVMGFDKEKNTYCCLDRNNNVKHLTSELVKLRVYRSENYNDRLKQQNQLAHNFGY